MIILSSLSDDALDHNLSTRPVPWEIPSRVNFMIFLRIQQNGVRNDDGMSQRASYTDAREASRNNGCCFDGCCDTELRQVAGFGRSSRS